MKEIFDEILTTFENEDLKEFFINKCIPTIPDYWYHAPASSSGMFHSPISLGDGGLMRHTLALVRILNYMFEVEIVKNQYTSRERDLLRIAGLLHDTRKSGSQEEYSTNKQTKFDHPLKAAEVIKGLDGIDDKEKKLICRVISRHMGVWNTSKRGSFLFLKKLPELLLHQSLVCEKNRSSNGKMSIDHREPICVIHRQGSNRAFAVVNFKILYDSCSIALYITI